VSDTPTIAPTIETPELGEVRLAEPTGHGSRVLLQALRLEALSGHVQPLLDTIGETQEDTDEAKVAEQIMTMLPSLLPLVDDLPAALVVAFCRPTSETLASVEQDPTHGGIDMDWARSNVTLASALEAMQAVVRCELVGRTLDAVKNSYRLLTLQVATLKAKT